MTAVDAAAPSGLASAATASEDGLDELFLTSLVQQLRAQDRYGMWDAKSEDEILVSFVLSKEKRKRLPILGDADAALRLRMELFYAAVAAAIERRAEVRSGSIVQLHDEGWGQAIVFAGRLVLINKAVRDAHRFGFADKQKIQEAGGALVREGVSWLERHPELARE